jgi:MFS transporter, OPA family, glycerol-3-phosphate transporter
VPFGRLLWQRVLTNPRVWLIALASSCTYIVRAGAIDWLPKKVFEGNTVSIAGVGMASSLLEFLGIPGALVCGWLSDRVFGARRAPVVFGSLVLLAASIGLLAFVPAGHVAQQAGVLALIGLFTYGPQCLLAGVSPVDMSSKRVAAAAVGFTGLASYAGAAIQSNVTGWLLDSNHGWTSVYTFWGLAALAGALLCVPLWRSVPGEVRGRKRPATAPVA